MSPQGCDAGRQRRLLSAAEPRLATSLPAQRTSCRLEISGQQPAGEAQALRETPCEPSATD